MPGFFNQTAMTLRERLKLHTGFPVTVRTGNLTTDPGPLEHVGRQFMKVAGRHYVPLSVDEVSLLGFRAEASGSKAELRTSISRGTFAAELLRTGEDFLEVLVARTDGGKDWLLIPLNKVIRVEKAD